MKKTISAIILTLGASFAFAVTDAQKATFMEKIKNDFVPAAQGAPFGEKLEQTYSAMKSATDPIAAFAMSEPEAYWNWAGETGLGGHVQWVVRYNLRKANPDVVYTFEQDVAINDSDQTFQKALKDKSVYLSLKAAGFKCATMNISPWKCMVLAENYGDPEAFDTFKPEQIAGEFNRYYAAILKANVSADAEVAWKRLVKARKTFSLYRTVKNGDGTLRYPKISDNWASLIADEDSAYVDYKRSK